MTTTPTKEVTIALMKEQVLEDISTCRVPAKVSDFSQLHDYVDANCYGDFCEDGVFEALHELGADAFCDFVNDCQMAVHEWLVTGRPTA